MLQSKYRWNYSSWGHLQLAANTREKPMNDDLMDSVAQEMLDAVDKKDHKLFIEALEALVRHIQEMDEEQDREEMK